MVVICTINMNRKLLTLSTWPFCHDNGILFQEHTFSSSSNNHITWQRFISLCCAVNSTVVTLMPKVQPYFLEVRIP